PTTTILYSFTGNSDCGEPFATLTPGPNGVFYGFTSGGWAHCSNGALGGGVMFAMTPSEGTYVFSIVHTFAGNGDDVPSAPLTIGAAGAYYALGNNDDCDDLEKLTPSGNGFKTTVAYTFSCADGYGYNPGMSIDTSGTIYGTNDNGGPHGAGIAYRLTPSGSTYVETVLHAFGSTGDGAYPDTTLTAGPNRTFYGTTAFGGKFGKGIAFEISSSGAYRKLYDFGASRNGGTFPIGNLLIDNSGNLYGETSEGGKSCPKSQGCGTAYRLTRRGDAYAETTLHSFYAHGRLTAPGLSGAGLTAEPDGELVGIFAGEQDRAWGVFALKPSGSGYDVDSTALGNSFSFINGPLVATGKPGQYIGTTFYGGANGIGCVFSVTFR
ncbi:MAG: hypothetical protein IAI50_20730, partial [Candidatus Eremiobacteraeota bacterium]|nr:hypothetical protein [Candidatus Eremiobacteraeota bacterium]